jgi:hypothetical protein
VEKLVKSASSKKKKSFINEEIKKGIINEIEENKNNKEIEETEKTNAKKASNPNEDKNSAKSKKSEKNEDNESDGSLDLDDFGKFELLKNQSFSEEEDEIIAPTPQNIDPPHITGQKPMTFNLLNEIENKNSNDIPILHPFELEQKLKARNDLLSKRDRPFDESQIKDCLSIESDNNMKLATYKFNNKGNLIYLV